MKVHLNHTKNNQQTLIFGLFNRERNSEWGEKNIHQQPLQQSNLTNPRISQSQNINTTLL
jgi:hypothetical protein